MLFFHAIDIRFSELATNYLHRWVQAEWHRSRESVREHGSLLRAQEYIFQGVRHWRLGIVTDLFAFLSINRHSLFETSIANANDQIPIGMNLGVHRLLSLVALPNPRSNHSRTW